MGAMAISYYFTADVNENQKLMSLA